MKHFTTTEEVLAELVLIKDPVLEGANLRDIAFRISCCRNAGRSEGETHGQLGRVTGFFVANAIFPGSAR